MDLKEHTTLDINSGGRDGRREQSGNSIRNRHDNPDPKQINSYESRDPHFRAEAQTTELLPLFYSQWHQIST